MSVYRKTPLPVSDLRGRYIIGEPMLAATKAALVGFALAGIHDGGHEGLVFWAGREIQGGAILTTVIVPNAQHDYGRVMVGKEAVGDASRKARHLGLGLLCQVHSHPGQDTRHSDGDDKLVLLPFEGMLSLVAPDFGTTLRSLADFAVHQFRDHRWTLCRSESVRSGLIVAPTVEDLR